MSEENFMRRGRVILFVLTISLIVLNVGWGIVEIGRQSLLFVFPMAAIMFFGKYLLDMWNWRQRNKGF